MLQVGECTVFPYAEGHNDHKSPVTVPITCDRRILSLDTDAIRISSHLLGAPIRAFAKIVFTLQRARHLYLARVCAYQAKASSTPALSLPWLLSHSQARKELHGARPGYPLAPRIIVSIERIASLGYQYLRRREGSQQNLRKRRNNVYLSNVDVYEYKSSPHGSRWVAVYRKRKMIRPGDLLCVRRMR